MAAPENIIRLVDAFESNYNTYKSLSYNEEDIKIDFINPLFEALGWDVGNKTNRPPELREVKFEDSVEVLGRIKNPDYSFRIERERKFFVEAKKPAVNIEDGISPAFQLRSYAWSASLPLSIVTDFEEFAVYDCRNEPSKLDKPSKSRLLIIKYYEFEKRWDEIASIFSKESVQNGSLDKYIESIPAKRGSKKVDEALLEDISEWREALAVNIAEMNPSLDQKSLNHAVQMTIDRILFLRICEDRSIEDYGRLKKLLDGENVYPRLFELFEEADKRYNSGLFHFHAEEDRNNFDTITPSIKIEDKVLQDIIRGLYFPDCPYVFSEIPAEILGRVYEQFLGKVIQLNENHEVDVAYKPEVRKAGGVYYTPSYIVEYIVKNTVGKLLEGKSPQEASELHILDPACGSGSFLIGAYQYLLDWHLDWYKSNLMPLLNAGHKLTSREVQGLLPAPIEKPGKDARARSKRIWERATVATLPIEQRAEEWHLRTAERKRILLNNIYGVDIDTQAVEVTKLSLLLKVLEGENKSTIADLSMYSDERALPDLGSNIKCGNSLIGWDILQDRPDLTQEELWRINPFDWNDGFKEIFARGGFDAVIGNPPYVNVTILGHDLKAALSKRYLTATRRFDLYLPFTEKSIGLLSKRGLLGFIMPSMFMRREYGIDLRKYISQNCKLDQIVDFGTYQVFKGPLNYVNIFIFNNINISLPISIIKIKNNKIAERDVIRALFGEAIDGIIKFKVSSDIFSSSSEWYLSRENEKDLIQKLFNKFPSIDSILAYASEGIHSGKDEVFFISKSKVNELMLESPPVYPLAKGKDIHRYQHLTLEGLNQRVIYPYDISNGQVLAPERIVQMAPNVWNYLQNQKKLLAGRSYFDKSNKKWYELWCPRNPSMFTSQKIAVPEITNKGNFTIIKESIFVNTKVKVIIPKENIEERIEYILGLLNSSLLVYLYKSIAPPKSGGFYAVKTRIIGRLPIRRIDFSDPSDVDNHDKMVSLVEKMLDLHKHLASSMTEHEKTMLSRQIQATDDQINSLVYELYGLNEDEIRIVEAQNP